MTVHLPEPAQQVERGLRQRNETVFIAFGIADVDTLTRRINITDFKTQPFPEAQTQALQFTHDATRPRRVWPMAMRSVQS